MGPHLKKIVNHRGHKEYRDYFVPLVSSVFQILFFSLIVVLKIKREMKQWSSVFDKNPKVHTVFVFLHAMGATVSQLFLGKAEKP